MKQTLVYRRGASSPDAELRHSFPGPVESWLWRPTARSFLPRGCLTPRYLAWSSFHFLRIFRNRDYGVWLVAANGRLLHRSSIFPPYYSFPFMNPDDLQIGLTWTDPVARGKGLASWSIQQILHLIDRPGRTVWYIVEEDNLPSIKAAERAGFTLAGAAVRRRILPFVTRYNLEISGVIRK